MTLLGQLWTKLKSAPSLDLTLLDVSAAGDGVSGKPIEPDECYVEVFVESLRIEEARRFATNFHGIVYTFMNLAREGDQRADLASICKPEKLAALDAGSIGNVLTVSRQVMGAIPWRGGNLHLELGLFCVKAGNLLTPVLNFVTQVSSTAGVSFIGNMAPFAPLLTTGMDMIAGQTGETAMEVGIDTDITLKASGIYAIVAAPKGEIDGKTVTLDSQDKKLLVNGKPLTKSFCVFSIRRVDQKPDFGEIAELKQKYGELQSAIRSNNMQAAKDALTGFRLSVVTCPDLISSDGRKLIQKATQKVSDAFQAGGISKKISDRDAEPLGAIGLYS